MGIGRTGAELQPGHIGGHVVVRARHEREPGRAEGRPEAPFGEIELERH